MNANYNSILHPGHNLNGDGEVGFPASTICNEGDKRHEGGQGRDASGRPKGVYRDDVDFWILDFLIGFNQLF